MADTSDPPHATAQAAGIQPPKGDHEETCRFRMPLFALVMAPPTSLARAIPRASGAAADFPPAEPRPFVVLDTTIRGVIRDVVNSDVSASDQKSRAREGFKHLLITSLFDGLIAAVHALKPSQVASDACSPHDGDDPQPTPHSLSFSLDQKLESLHFGKMLSRLMGDILLSLQGPSEILGVAFIDVPTRRSDFPLSDSLQDMNGNIAFSGMILAEQEPHVKWELRTLHHAHHDLSSIPTQWSGPGVFPEHHPVRSPTELAANGLPPHREEQLTIHTDTGIVEMIGLPTPPSLDRTAIHTTSAWPRTFGPRAPAVHVKQESPSDGHLGQDSRSLARNADAAPDGRDINKESPDEGVCSLSDQQQQPIAHAPGEAASSHNASEDDRAQEQQPLNTTPQQELNRRLAYEDLRTAFAVLLATLEDLPPQRRELWGWTPLSERCDHGMADDGLKDGGPTSQGVTAPCADDTVPLSECDQDRLDEQEVDAML